MNLLEEAELLAVMAKNAQLSGDVKVSMELALEAAKCLQLLRSLRKNDD